MRVDAIVALAVLMSLGTILLNGGNVVALFEWMGF